MKGSVKFDVGKTTYTLGIDEGKDMEMLHTLAVLGNPPQYCSECKNNQFFRLDSNKDKEANIYVNVVCTKCGAKAKLGQYKSGGYFWHKFEKYVRKGETPTKQAGENFSTAGEDESSEAPF